MWLSSFEEELHWLTFMFIVMIEWYFPLLLWAVALKEKKTGWCPLTVRVVIKFALQHKFQLKVYFTVITAFTLFDQNKNQMTDVVNSHYKIFYRKLNNKIHWSVFRASLGAPELWSYNPEDVGSNQGCVKNSIRCKITTDSFR